MDAAEFLQLIAKEAKQQWRHWADMRGWQSLNWLSIMDLLERAHNPGRTTSKSHIVNRPPPRPCHGHHSASLLSFRHCSTSLLCLGHHSASTPGFRCHSAALLHLRCCAASLPDRGRHSTSLIHLGCHSVSLLRLGHHSSPLLC